MVEIRLRKSYEATTKEEVNAAIMQIIIEKIREIVGNKRIRITVKSDGDE